MVPMYPQQAGIRSLILKDSDTGRSEYWDQIPASHVISSLTLEELPALSNPNSHL